MPVLTTHRFNERPTSRRQGQALIIAVLVMLLAALLSSAFLVLVANQGHVVGRAYERDLARSTAQQGYDQVTALLKASPNSDDWQAEAEPSLVGLRTSATVINPADLPPGIGDADYDFYWSPLDKAQGWALNLKYTSGATDLTGRLAELAAFKRQGGRVFVKVPNPLLNRRQIPAYMVESRLLDQAVDEASDGGDKKFMMRVTIIGLSPRGDSSWARQTLYKPTNYNGAAFSFAQFVSNYSVDSKTFLTAPVVATGNIAVGTTQLRLNVLSTKFSAADFPVGRQLMLSDALGQVTSVTVTNATGTQVSYNPTTQILNFTPTTIALDGPSTTLSATGTMMTSPFSLDPDGAGGNSAVVNGPDKLALAVGLNANTDTSNFGNGYCFNLGLTVRGQGTVGLRPAYPRNQGGFVTYSGQNALLVTGPVHVTNVTPITNPAVPTPVPVNSQIKIVNTTLANPTPIAIPPSAPADNRFLSVSFDGAGNPRRDTFLSQTDPLLLPRSVTPPSLDFNSGKNYSKLAQGSDPVLGPLGYGDGVYISNTDDVESFNGTPLNSGQIQRLWQRKSFDVAAAGNVTPGSNPLTVGTTGARLCYARPGVDSYTYPMSGGGLEAQGLRGWISPWEYLPRGAQVILDGANSKITIIRDPMSASGALTDTKAWKNLDGTVNPSRPFKMELNLVNGTRTVGGGTTALFTQTNATFNGIIAAEGNLRVSGDWSASTRPLTIVSKNNIYIEGSTIGQAGKLALLAKQNVVVNPTQFVTRPEGLVDRAVGATAYAGTNVTASTVDVPSINNFALGQFITIGDDAQIRTVTAINGTTLTFAPAVTTTPLPFDRYTPTSTNAEVRQVCDPAVVLLKTSAATDTPANSLVETPSTAPQNGVKWAYAWKKRGDTLLRQFPTNMPTPRLNVEQGVQRIDVKFNAKRTDGTYRLRTRTNSDNTSGGKLIKASIAPQATPDPQPTPNPTPVADFEVDMRNLSTVPTPDPTPGSTPSPGIDDDTTTVEDGDPKATLGRVKERLEYVPTPDHAPAPDANWEVVYPTPVAAPGVTPTPLPYSSIPVRRLAAVDRTIAANDAERGMNVPLLPSVDMLFNPASVANLNPLTSLLNTIGSWFGFYPAAPEAVPTTQDTPELAVSTTDAFIAGTMKWNSLTDANYATNYTFAGATTGGVFALQRDPTDRQDLLPAYYVSGWHWENPAAIYSPATSVTIQATIYAESGSWFVIPQPSMTAQDTAVGDASKALLYRPLTQIIVNSSIAQGYSPSADLDYDLEPDPEGRAFGATKTWLDALARPTGADTSGVPGNYDVIQYGALPLPANLAPGDRVNLPTSGDILYTYIS